VTRLLALAAVVLAIATAWALGVHEHLTPERVAELVARAGVLGPIAFVALFAAAEVVHVPGILFVFAAALLWPAAIALPTAYAGAMAASLVPFLLSRHLLADSVRPRLPVWLTRWESRLDSHALSTVIGLRLVLFMLPTVHWLLGVSRVSFRDFFLGTAIGLAPGVAFNVLLGRSMFEHWDVVRPWVIGGAIVLAAVAVIRRLRHSARRDRAHEDLQRLG
jgi:uncharacterized membrane protein YdjX (TVP38/TMEM64 family)